MQGKSSRRSGYWTTLWSATILMGLSLTLVLGQDVILNPVDITGRVEIGDEPLQQVSMRAESGSFLATQAFTPDAADLTVVEYSLTVDVPEGGDRTYAVQPESIFMDEYQDMVRLAPQDVMVSDGVPGSADFIVTPGYLEGVITNESSREIGTVQIHGLYPQAPGATTCYSRAVAPCFTASTNEARSFAYRIPVEPGTGIHLHPKIYLGDGTTINLDSVVVDIAEGATVVQDFVLPAAEGSVSGTLAMPGAETPARHTVVVNGPGQHVAQLTEAGPFEILELADGGYSIFFTSWFGDNSSRLNNFNHPYANLDPGRSFIIENGSAATVDASTEQAFLEGIISITDSASNADVSFISHYFTGSSSESSGGSTAGYVDDPATGAYRFVFSQGTWGLRQVAVSIERNGTQLADQFREFIRINYNNAGAPPVEGITGETSTYDISIPMGKVTVRFGVAGGLPLSDPRLEIGCSLNDEAEQRLFSYSGNSRGQNQENVTEAITSFLAPEGACLLTARAVVNGTLTSFGQVEVDVEPGVTKVIDVGAPTLIIDYPSPELHVTDPILVVLGRASDDVEVTSVTINGGDPLTLTSTGNQDDPNEVSFEGQQLTLVPGANLIETTARDGADNSTTDTRTVYYDGEASPPVLDWTPADGTETTEANIEIAGTADDAEGIESITVEGVEVSFTSTGNSAKPNEVAFTTSMVLVPGENLITVVATNVDELQTSQTHAVTLIEDAENTPPVADAGDDITQLCDGPCDEDCGTLVTLDGSGSSDDDDDDLTYTWTGPFPEGEGTITGVMPQVTLPLGTHEITLTVDDGSEQDMDTVMVTVEVEVIGLNPPLAGLVKAGGRPAPPRHSFNHGRTLPLRFGLYCGGIALGKDDVEAPEIVGLMDDQGGEVDLSAIDLDSGKSNGDTLFFRHGDEQWIYNLNTKVLNAGTTYTITIRMPGGQDYQASFTLREGRSSSSRSTERKR